MTELVKEIVDSEDKTAINAVIQEASSRLSLRLSSKDSMILMSILYTEDRLGLSPLHLSNIYNYMISTTGKISRIRTKAWDKSRRKVDAIKIMLREEIKDVAREFRSENYH